ncbi:MAG: acyl carrier protein [Chloroflexota bacterium]
MNPVDLNYRRIILEQLAKVAPGAPVDRLEDDENIREALDIDSFDSLNFLIALHEKTGVDIKEKDYGKLNTIQEILDYLVVRAY